MSKTEMIEANKVKAIKIPKEESHLVHADVQAKQFDPETGKPISKPFRQIFDVAEWHNVLEHPNGLIFTVVHLPTGAMTPEQYQAKKVKDAEKKKEIK